MEDEELIEVNLSVTIKPWPEEEGIDQPDKLRDRLLAVMQESGEVTIDVLEVKLPAGLQG